MSLGVWPWFSYSRDYIKCCNAMLKLKINRSQILCLFHFFFKGEMTKEIRFARNHFN